MAGFTVSSFKHSSKGTPKDMSASAIENTLISRKGMEGEMRSVLMVSPAAAPPRSSPASLLSEGISPVQVKEQLGHSSIQMTVDIYGIWIPNRKHTAVNRLDWTFSGNFGSPRAHPAENENAQPVKIARLSAPWCRRGDSSGCEKVNDFNMQILKGCANFALERNPRATKFRSLQGGGPQ